MATIMPITTNIFLLVNILSSNHPLDTKIIPRVAMPKTVMYGAAEGNA